MGAYPLDTAKDSPIGAVCMIPTTTGSTMDPEPLCEVPRAWGRALAERLSAFGDRSATPHEAIARAFSSGACIMQESFDHFGLRCSTVGCAVRRIQAKCAEAGRI
jgi:hypothetical protein